MKEIKSFIFYYDWQHLIKNFSYAQKGKLLDAILHHVIGEEITFPDLDAELTAVFEFLKIYLDRDKEKYLKKCEKAAENAKKRYEKKEKDVKNKSGAAYDLDEFEEKLNEE